MALRLRFFIFVFFAFSLPGNTYALCQVYYNFIAVDRIHLMVVAASETMAGTTAGKASGLRLYHEGSGGGKKLIATTAIEDSGKWRFSENIRLTDLQPGNQTLILYELINGAESGQVSEQEINRISVPLPATPTLAGQPLFDESITNIQGLVLDSTPWPGPSDQWIAGSALGVPSGIHVELREITEGECRDNGISMGVAGSLTIGDSTFTCSHSFGSSGYGSITIEDSRFQETGFAGTNVTISGSRLQASSIFAGTLDISDCLFIGNTPLSATTSGFVHGNEFHPLDFYNDVVTLYQGMNFTGNVVAMQMQLYWEPGSPPSFTGNSFLAPNPFIISGTNQGETLDASGNYWGAEIGELGGWLDGRKPLLDPLVIASNPLKTGPFRVCSLSDPRPVPQVFIDEIAYGQNAFSDKGPSYPVVNRDTMISVLPRATDNSPDGVRIRAFVDDVEIAPENDFVVKGDPGLPSSSANRDYTANFRIPASSVTPGEHLLKVTADTTGLNGYVGTGTVTEAYRSMVFTPAYARGLNIGVVHVNLKLDGYLPAPEKGAAAKVIQYLKRDIPAMWPLRSEDLRVDDIGGFTYDGGFFGSFLPGLFSSGFANNLSWALSSFMAEYNAVAPVKYDLLVAVLPINALGGADGMNLSLRRRVALVDSSSPGAAIHELGHALGLYTSGSEQYLLPSGQNDYGETVVHGKGIAIKRITAFNPEGRSSTGVLDGFLHFGASTTVPKVWDIMGSADPQWISPTSLHEVTFGLAELLGTDSTPASPAKALSNVETNAAPAFGKKRILVRGVLQLGTNMYGANSFRFVPGSASAEDVTNTGAEPITRFYNTDYELVSLDANDIETRSFWCQHPYSSTEGGPWSQSFDIPDDTVRILLRERYDRTVILDLATGPGLSTVLSGPQPGPVTAPLLFSWISSPGLGGNDLLYHQLQVSTDNGSTWRNLGAARTASSLEIPEEELPSGDLTFRLVTSDGVSSAVDMLSGYSLEAPQPELTIISPRAKDRSLPDIPWRLSAEAAHMDPDTTFTWTSNLDGNLGSGQLLDTVKLTTGNHLLTCRATDDSGHDVSATVSVSVGSMANVDLSVDAAALAVFTDGVDPALGHAARLSSGSNATLTLTVRNQGLNGTAKVALYAAEDGGQETLIGSRNMAWSPFESAQLSVDYLPTGTGNVTLRAVLTALAPADSNTANNTRTWSFGNGRPEAHGNILTLAAGSSAGCPLAGADPNGDQLSYTLLSQPAKGTLTGTPPDLIYMSDGSAGWDSFSFLVSDGQLTSEPATVYLYLSENGHAVTLHKVDASAGSGGSIAPAGRFPAIHGEEVSFVMSPLQGRQMDSLLVNGQDLGNSLNYTLRIVADQDIEAQFRFEDWNGPVTLEDAIMYLKILAGDSQSINHNIEDIDINGDNRVGLEEIMNTLNSVIE